MDLDLKGHRWCGTYYLFKASCNDRPHPNLLPPGEGTAIAGASLRGCAPVNPIARALEFMGSRREFFEEFSPRCSPSGRGLRIAAYGKQLNGEFHTTRDRFPFSPGEKAGMRASTILYYPSIRGLSLGGYPRSFAFSATTTITGHVTDHLNEGQEHRNDDTTDDHSEEDNHDRFEEGGHRANRVIDLFIVPTDPVVRSRFESGRRKEAYWTIAPG